ncbi:alpha/beta hydrolase fold protein [Thalassoporum mexicanum PCC 7367]|uniref:alpha/beta fold hydrolase n=1 Tax=Thalassoporum mexicanum TaxID=3457544 RepID=UPI00029FA7DE|nr:alpha/beta hydrolase [Pseudanabaena sp. PCC 7367]AFY68770.1 alpha/beta hydrolase fold protein [Pseudanabaena sp. PCC 7367]
MANFLCLHGHPGNGACMDIFTEHLTAQGYQILAPDLRGYGKFKAKQAFAMQDHLSDLSNLIMQPEYCHHRFILLGWSLGGILALELALKFPDRIAGMILIASAARPLSSHPTGVWHEVANTGLAVLLNQVFPTWQFPKQIGRRSLLNYLVQTHSDRTYAYITKYGAAAFLQTSRQATTALSSALKQGYDRRSALTKIKQPCLVIAGAQDRHITAASSQETATLLPNSTWICYPQAAHLLPWEIPDRLLADIDIWLEQNDLID